MPALWKQDLVEDRGRIWTNYVWGRWRVEQGYCLEPGKLWSLLRVVNGRQRWVSDHKLLSEAKRAAEEAQVSEEE